MKVLYMGLVLVLEIVSLKQVFYMQQYTKDWKIFGRVGQLNLEENGVTSAELKFVDFVVRAALAAS